MRKLWLTFTAMLLCSIASFAQSQFGGGTGTQTDPYLISEPAHFKAIATQQSTSGKYFKLTADINLGTYHADNNNFVIESFSGTFDGGDNTITYNGSFTLPDGSENEKVGLFKTVSGTIKNLNLNANITVSGDNAKKVRIGLLCGDLNDGGTIEFCDVTGNINSTVKSGTTGNASTGLIIGNNFGDLQYCTGHGNVTGIGYVGGLVGSMGMPIYNEPNSSMTPLIKGCYFTGNVTANNSNTLNFNWGIAAADLRSFGGGICGVIMSPAKIELCVAEAIVVVGAHGAGIANSEIYAGWLVGDWQYNGVASNNYCTGTVNGETVDGDNIFAGNNGTANIFDTTPENLSDIVTYLNNQRGDDADKFYFAVINGKVVLVIGQEPTDTPTLVCEAPTGLTVTENEGIFTASWSMVSQDNDFTESNFVLTVTGGDLTTAMVRNVQGATSITSDQALPASANPYVFTVKSKCSEELSSAEVTYTLYVDADCPSVSGLQVTGVTTEAANVSWIGDADTIKLNGSVKTFNGQTLALTGLTPATEYTIEAIVNCTRHEGETEIPYQLSTSVTFVTEATDYVTAQSGNFYNPATWVGGKEPTGNPGTTITIRDGHRVRLDGTLVLNGTIINRGVLVIPQSSGQLINMTENNVTGIVEIETGNKENQAWTFIGAPFKTGYALETIVPVPGNDDDGISDISVKKYDYNKTNADGNATPGWSDSWAHIGTAMKAGEGYFGYPFYGGVVTFTTYGDVCTWDAQNSRYVIGSYNFDSIPVTALNNGDVIVEETIAQSNNGYWMALSNPYPAKLSVTDFLAENGSKLQGNCVYVFRNGTFANGNISTGEIAIAEGFFVNFKANAEKKVVFTKNQLKDFPNSTQNAPAEFIELTLQNGDNKVRAYLAHNENAEQGYDIFDANKLFAPTEIAEPYFVTDGIELMKEEFAELPYYATMNVRSFADDTVSFVVNNIPEGLAVSIIDGEEVIDMIEGGVYTTEILTGENADRFKVLIKKSVSISDVEELEVNITNNNRHISIETTETDLQVEVYNALGQKVLSTKDRNFTLNQVSAGAYLIKAFNNKASKTQKIVVE